MSARDRLKFGAYIFLAMAATALLYFSSDGVRDFVNPFNDGPKAEKQKAGEVVDGGGTNSPGQPGGQSPATPGNPNNPNSPGGSGTTPTTVTVCTPAVVIGGNVITPATCRQVAVN